MSYPSQIHTLVVEDDKAVRDSYSQVFDELVMKGYPVAAPAFALSYDEARAKLESKEIYHLVILDLGLPLKSRQQAEAGVEPGELLVKHVAEREHYPVPALLVVSGRLGGAKIPDLQQALDEGFWYGRIVSKGQGESDEIKKAIEALPKYCGVGIHMQDAGQNWYPTLSPREEDMLRRCVLSKDHIGLDLRWWRAEPDKSGARETKNSGATKVLMGRFLLDEGLGSSRPTFFKFEPSANGEHTFHNARIMDEKLQHVEVCYMGESPTRSLLVTQSVCDTDPTGLDEFLASEPEKERSVFASVVGDIWEQLLQLGQLEDAEVDVRDVLWSHLSREDLDEMWYAHRAEGLEPSPVTLFDQLKASGHTEWAKVKAGNHGDLNASNIAVEQTGAEIRAFIIDAGAIQRGIAVRDLADLEATSMLFQPGANDLITECGFLYGDSVPPLAELPLDGKCLLSRQLARLIAEIRTTAISVGGEELYALLVFDAAIRQLSGFAFQRSQNKISSGSVAARYAAIVGRWLKDVAPGLFTE